jgi:hypothetical protein
VENTSILVYTLQSQLVEMQQNLSSVIPIQPGQQQVFLKVDLYGLAGSAGHI